MSDADLGRQLVARVGQCVLTCASTACFAGIEGGDARAPLGKSLRFFGDGYQVAKKIGERRYWRIPVMDGEFLVEHDTGVVSAVGGGNFLILATSRGAAQAASQAAVDAMRRLPNVALPFPGGIVRSGSKVGSKYPKLIASTNDAYCPTLRSRSPRTALPPEVEAVLEIVIDGLTEADVAEATAIGVRPSARSAARPAWSRSAPATTAASSALPLPPAKGPVVSRPAVLRLEADPGLPVDMTGVLPGAARRAGRRARSRPCRSASATAGAAGRAVRVAPGAEPAPAGRGTRSRASTASGAGMVAGTIEVHGDCRRRTSGSTSAAAAGRRAGSAGDFVGAEMRGGTISVRARRRAPSWARTCPAPPTAWPGGRSSWTAAPATAPATGCAAA
jgi:hypothetical protein